MSLKISGNQIIVQNADGSTKFTSDNKLVYKKYITSGSLTLGSTSGPKAVIPIGTTFDSSKDMALLYVTLTGGSGNVVSQMIGSTLQLNFPLLMHFDHSTSSVQITAWDVLTGLVLGSQLEFAAVSAIAGKMQVAELYSASSTPVSFDWKLVILSYR